MKIFKTLRILFLVVLLFTIKKNGIIYSDYIQVKHSFPPPTEEIYFFSISNPLTNNRFSGCRHTIINFSKINP